MSDVPESPRPPAQSDTTEALARMARFGNSSKGAKRSGGWGPLVITLAVLLPLASVAAVAWLQMEMRKELESLRADNAALRQQSEGSTTQVAQLQQSQQELGNDLEQTQQELGSSLEVAQRELQQNLQQALEQTFQRELSSANAAAAAQAQRIDAIERQVSALREAAPRPANSPLSDAEALLSLAQQGLVLARDIPAAIALYVAADGHLAPLDDPRVVPVRGALARELAALRAVPLVDVSGLFTQLSAQAALVDELAAAMGASAVAASAAQAGTAAASNDWWARLQQTIGEYFVVTHSSDAAMPQLDGEEQLLIRALIQLRIEQAKLALLRADPPLYQRALDEALSTSQQWLNSEDASAAEFLAALESLRETPIVSDIPSVDEALSALREIVATGEIAPPLRPADPTPQPAAQESTRQGTQR